MRNLRQFSDRRRSRAAGFTLLEMLVAVTILTLIIYGLFAMFNQTQRAFHRSVTQVDVMESGRAAVDLLARELEQVTATHVSGFNNLYFTVNTNIGSGPLALNNSYGATNLFGTNGAPVIQDLFFVTRTGNQWSGFGYFVDRASTNYSEDASAFNAGVGTLYRFNTNTVRLSTGNNTNNLAFMFATSKPADYQRITDGIVHLRVRGFDRNGNERAANVFTGDDLPAYIDLEVGILEPKVLAEAKARGTAANIQNFLSTGRAAGAVHLFRHRIAIRTALQ